MDKNFDLTLISRKKLNKLVQRHILTHDIKKFSSYISRTFEDGFLEYNQVLASILDGLYNAAGKKLKDYKNMPSSGVAPDYMSAMELIRYRDAINSTKERYKDLLENYAAYSAYYYREAKNAGCEAYQNFIEYLNFFNFIYKGGESINSEIIKNFNKALKLKLYHKVLSSIPERKKNGMINDFNPYYEKFNDYEKYRKKFVQIVDYFSKYNFTDNQIRHLFRTYEKTYYNTDFLKDKNIDLINYTLGLSKGTYFSKKDLEVYEKCVSYIIDVIIDEVRDYDETIEYIQKKATEDRERFIDENMQSGKRPENSDIFLVACLDKIVEEKRQKELKEMKIMQVEPYSNEEYSTKNILDLPDSIRELSKMVSQSIVDKRNQINSKPPSMFDLGLIEDKPSNQKAQDHCQ